jgi:restriction system protein
MAIPDFQSLFAPTLQVLADGQEHTVHQIREQLVGDLQLSPDDLAEKLKSGQGVFVNRVAWALVHLKRAGAVVSTGKGSYRITAQGHDLMRRHADEPMAGVLKSLSGTTAGTLSDPTPDPVLTPEEQLDKIVQTIRTQLAEEILERVQQISPAAFERLVLKLLTAIGYGGTVEGAAVAVGKPGDGGIDGIIQQDKLGLDFVYVQAKRWQANVGRPDVMKFCGGLTAHHANKGVLLATSAFTSDAIEYAKRIPQKIVLVGGKQMADLMIEHNVGVVGKQHLSIKKIDPDYFETL